MNKDTDNASRLSARARAALLEALEDERASEAFYQAVIERHGPVRPFVNILESERRHQRRLLGLCRDYGVPIPPRKPPREIELADSLESECRRAIVAEKDNIEMYDRFLAEVDESDIRDAFHDLRRASRDNHLRAFQRCAGRHQGRGV